MGKKRKVPNLPRWDCPWYADEIGLAKAIPFRLLRWAVVNKISAARLLGGILFNGKNLSPLALHLGDVVSLGQHGDAHRREMVRHFEFRMDRALQCLDPETLLKIAVSHYGCEHLDDCSHCRSEMGWFRGLLEFYEEYRELELA